MAEPQHRLVDQLRHMPLVRGAKGSVEELRGLYAQAQFLAGMLDRWNSNQDGDNVEDVVVASTTETR